MTSKFRFAKTSWSESKIESTDWTVRNESCSSVLAKTVSTSNSQPSTVESDATFFMTVFLSVLFPDLLRYSLYNHRQINSSIQYFGDLHYPLLSLRFTSTTSNITKFTRFVLIRTTKCCTKINRICRCTTHRDEQTDKNVIRLVLCNSPANPWNLLLRAELLM